MNTIEKIEDDIIHEFEQFATIEERYAHLYKLGESHPGMDLSLKTEANQVNGCQNIVWFHITFQYGRIHLQADSDSMFSKGVMSVLMRLVSGHKPNEVLLVNFDFFEILGLNKLASHNNPGLKAMFELLHKYAQESIQPKN